MLVYVIQYNCLVYLFWVCFPISLLCIDLLHHCVIVTSAFELYLIFRGDSYTVPEFICVFIDTFVHNITVSVLICLCMLYNIIVCYTSFWVCFPISLLCIDLLHHFVIVTSAFELKFLWILYLSLLRYVCVLHNTDS